MLKGNKVWTPNGYQSGPVNSLVGKGESIIDYTNGTGTLVTKGKVGVDNQPSSVSAMIAMLQLVTIQTGAMV